MILPMKAERLLAILTALLGRDRISAGELARRLENVITSYSIHYTKLYDLLFVL